jgi:hypothetical protein
MKIKQDRQIAEGSTFANRTIEGEGDAFQFDVHKKQIFSTTSTIHKDPR